LAGSTLLWLALLAIMAVLFVVTLRRMSQLIARTRGLERFQRTVEGFDRRLAGAVEPLVAALDGTRRRTGDPSTLGEQLAAAQEVLEGLRAECRTLPTPAGLTAAAVGLAGDLDRAIRACSMVEHGLGAMATASLGRDLEAQTALKRGALNLRHAREAFSARAREIAAVRPGDLVPGAVRGSSLAPPLAIYRATELEDPEGRFDPRM
jgi:hypothetical protein